MKRHKKHEENENVERWLLTYADLITLLLGLFVILYAMSKIDAGKYGKMIEALGGIFGHETVAPMNGGHVIEPPVPVLHNERIKIEKEIMAALAKDNRLGSIFVSHNERGLTIHIMDEMLFTSGSAELKTPSLSILDSLARILKKLPNDIRVEGHTDNVPIRSEAFASNWHLSVARAVNAAHYMISTCGIVPERVGVVGYSEYHPLVPNTSEQNRARNRRVDIVIATSVSHESDKDNPLTGGN